MKIKKVVSGLLALSIAVGSMYVVSAKVAGSSPAGGATQKNQNKPITYSDFLTNMARWSSG